MNELLHSQLTLGAILFVLGLIGFMTRRNMIVMVLCAELMLHGVSINLTSFGRVHQHASGQVFTIFVLTIAACEAGLALSLILALYQRRKSLDISLWSSLEESGFATRLDDPPVPLPEPEAPLPRLTPAGVRPVPNSRPSDLGAGSTAART